MRSRPLLAALLALLLVGGCAGGGGSGPPEKKPEVILSTPEVDERVGREEAEKVATQMGFAGSPRLQSYVEQVGRRVARNAPSGGFSYTFQVVDQDSPNAFALPGGYVFVSRGLLAMSNSEAELANVLGHEIVHVARRHAAARQSVMSALPGLLQYIAMGQVAAYGRDQEREADRLGQGLAALAGYDPAGLGLFLNSLEFSERLQLGFSRFQGYLDTHPATRERVAAADARARSIAWTGRPTIAGSERAYLGFLDGLVIGTAAAEGVVERGRFLHPDMGFSLLFPEGWEVVNTKAAVGAVSPRLDAQVVLELQGRGDDAEAAAQEFMSKAQQEGVSIEQLERVQIGPLNAVRAQGRAVTARAPIAIHITWIARGGAILRLTGAAVGTGNKMSGVFNNVARSFRALSPAERRSIRETRLRVVEAAAGESLSELSQRTGNEWNIQETAVMNGVFANARLEAGQLVKVAISQPYSGGGQL